MVPLTGKHGKECQRTYRWPDRGTPPAAAGPSSTPPPSSRRTAAGRPLRWPAPPPGRASDPNWGRGPGWPIGVQGGMGVVPKCSFVSSRKLSPHPPRVGGGKTPRIGRFEGISQKNFLAIRAKHTPRPVAHVPFPGWSTWSVRWPIRHFAPAIGVGFGPDRNLIQTSWDSPRPRPQHCLFRGGGVTRWGLDNGASLSGAPVGQASAWPPCSARGGRECRSRRPSCTSPPSERCRGGQQRVPSTIASIHRQGYLDKSQARLCRNAF